MNWYTTSWSRPSNRSTSVLGPAGVSNSYSPTLTIGSRRRRAASASSARVASFSATISSSPACRQSSAATISGCAMVVILSVGTGLSPAKGQTTTGAQTHRCGWSVIKTHMSSYTCIFRHQNLGLSLYGELGNCYKLANLGTPGCRFSAGGSALPGGWSEHWHRLVPFILLGFTVAGPAMVGLSIGLGHEVKSDWSYATAALLTGGLFFASFVFHSDHELLFGCFTIFTV